MGHFLLGFTIGAAVGAVAVIVGSPRSGAATRQGFKEVLEGARETARRASSAREQELWSDFRGRITKAHMPSDPTMLA